MATHASRNTTTGAIFEEKVHMEQKGINITKHDLYRFLSKHVAVTSNAVHSPVNLIIGLAPSAAFTHTPGLSKSIE